MTEIEADKKGVNKKRLILLIDDEPVVLFAHRLFLEKLGYAVKCASSSKEAIEVFKSDIFDAIVLDYNLRDKDKINGVDVFKQIKTLEQVNLQIATPAILITTSYQDEAVINECAEAGISEIAKKPIKIEELAIILRRWIKNKQE